jgi:hypothetical protein
MGKTYNVGDKIVEVEKRSFDGTYDAKAVDSKGNSASSRGNWQHWASKGYSTEADAAQAALKKLSDE